MLSHLAAWLAPAVLQVDPATAAIAVIALVFSIWSFRNQRRMDYESLRIQRDNDIIRWGYATIELIVEIEFLLRGVMHKADVTTFASQRDEYLSQLSAAIDKGRLHFPNVEHESYGTHKEPAFRGRRQPILDRLVEIYDLVMNLNGSNREAIDKTREPLLKKKREFVSEVQRAVDPRRRIEFIAAGIDQKAPEGIQP